MPTNANTPDGDPSPDSETSQPATVTLPALGSGRGPFATGELVSGRFRVLREIAEGGMGVVYLATDEKLNQPRALKVAKLGYGMHLPPEARSALRVTHPNVCRVFEIHTAQTLRGEVDFLSMEFVDGGTLWRRLRANGPIAEPEARALAEQICAGLGAAHAQNLLHRDLKPSNVLLTKDGKGGVRAVVTDFGLAQDAVASEPNPGGPEPLATGVAGTPGYVAPERYRGQPASVATDIYALGIVLHEMIAGHRPAGKPGTPQVLDPTLPARWRKVIGRCLAEDPAKRFASARAVAEAFTDKAARRRRMGAAALAVAALLIWLRALVLQTPPARLAVLPVEALGADASLTALVRGASFDLSSRLTRLRPKPPQLVVIPIENTQDLSAGDTAGAKQRVGASHVLRASVRPHGKRLLLRGSIVDTSTHVVLREIAPELDSVNEVSARLAALVASVFNLPRQHGGESVAPAAYSDYAAGMLQLRGRQSGYQQAIAAFERAIALDPKSPLPRARLAEACYVGWQATLDAKWLSRGREELRRAMVLNPDSLAVHLAAGELNLAPGSQDRAAQEFQRAIQLDPSSSEAWRGLAHSYEGMEGRQSDAAGAYMKAIQLQPDYYAPVTDFADFQRRMGNYGEARSLWIRAIALAPQSAALHSNLGGLYADMGQWDAAERELKRALELDSRMRIALNNLGSLYQYLGRDADAVKVFERARATSAESYILALNLADSYRRIGDAHAAAEAYRRGRKLAEQRLLANPGDAAVRAFFAYFALRLGDRGTAGRELVQALHFGGKDRTVIRRAVICFEAMNQRDRALDVLQSATPDVIRELNRNPDLTALRQDARFIALVPKDNSN